MHELGLTWIERVVTHKVYLVAGALTRTTVKRLADELLADPVSERFNFHAGTAPEDTASASIEIHLKPGVMDPVADSVGLAAADMGIDLAEVRTAFRYLIGGARSAEDLEQIAARVLANDCIHDVYVNGFGRQEVPPPDFPVAPQRDQQLRHVGLIQLDDEALRRMSRDSHLFLSLEEMRTIQEYYRDLGRDPTDVELETLAQTWSEHCVHKTLNSEINYHGAPFRLDAGTEQIEAHFDNLFKATIVAATRTLDKPWCVSVFVDNAGLIEFDDEYAVAFKVETHNHPSAIEPYGGAATGIGGCIRDIMGCGLGAKPIANTDVFCFARPDFPRDELPKGVIHPRRVLKGVVAGVRDYGNRMGIPTVNGAILFDDRYLGNPLVYCGCVGLIPLRFADKKANPGDVIVLVGGRTGRDGIHGATFSSAELTDTHAGEFSHAVQIGNPIEEKKVLDALLAARDYEDGCLYSALTDCGAGGLSSAVGEMGEEIGARVDLENVPLKYSGLRYDEIWISEAQERMVLAVPPHKLDQLLEVFSREDVQATPIGCFTNDQNLVIRHNGNVVGELEMTFLHDGLPRTVRSAEWSAGAPAKQPARREDARQDLKAALLDRLGDLNVAGKEWVIRQYDHEVQGGSAIKPLVGKGAGPSDAAVIRPRLDRDRGVVIACGVCPQLYDVDPYRMAVAAVDEALRNVICVGGDPLRTAILDNFCWGKTEDPRQLGTLVRACVGARDAAVAYGLPFISGKDSLNNEFSMSPDEARRLQSPERISIPGTLLISAISIVDDVNRCIRSAAATPGDYLLLVGSGRWELDEAVRTHRAVHRLIADGLVAGCHDVSDGGMIVAVAEMCIAGDGAQIELPQHVDPFAENLAQYIIEVSDPEVLQGVDVENVTLGRVTDDDNLRIRDGGREVIIQRDELSRAWRQPLDLDAAHPGREDR